MGKFDLNEFKDKVRYGGCTPVIKLSCSSKCIFLYLNDFPCPDMKAVEDFVNSSKVIVGFVTDYTTDVDIQRAVDVGNDEYITDALDTMVPDNLELYSILYKFHKSAMHYIRYTWYKYGDGSKLPDSTVEEDKRMSNLDNLATPKQSTPTQEEFLGRQFRCYANKLKHGFNVTDFQKEARFILKELSELMDAIEHNDVENIIEELGDIVIFCYGIAEMAHRDLDTQVFKKMAINESREYYRNKHGDFIKKSG